MTASRRYGLALHTERQLWLSRLDMAYHTAPPPYDTTAILKDVTDKYFSFAYIPNTHYQSSFGHLIGYDAGYYGYQWALSLSRDVLTRFRKEGLLNPTTAAAWRDEVLSRGGGADERAMIARFLGREPSHESYIAYLKGQD